MPRRVGWLALALLLTGGAVRAAPAAGAWHVAVVVPRFLTAGGAPATVAAQVRDGAGGPAPDGTPVTFVANLGLVVTPARAVTVGGVAMASMAPATESGFAQIDAQAGTDRGQALMWVRPGPASRVLGLDAQPTQLVVLGQAALTARLTDDWGNPAEGDAVDWTATGGTVAPATGRVDHGVTQALFAAGPSAGPASVHLSAAGATARVALRVDDPVPTPPGRPVWLPIALEGLARAGACEDVLSNGSFEVDADGDGLPDGWSVAPGNGAVSDAAPDALEGLRAVQLSGAPDGVPPVLRQSITVAPGATTAELWLWARGSAPDTGVRLAVWSTVPLGQTVARAPLLVTQAAVPEPVWVRLAFRLPLPPTGATDMDLAPWSSTGAATMVAVDALQLRVCR
jgi:hypothetical protein